MSITPDKRQICAGIQKQNFTCIRCGACCQESEPDSNLVMVGPDEVRKIMAATSLSFEEVAEPYPDIIREGELKYTFGWVIRRIRNQCQFLKQGRCIIYETRPWICRTYPFMLVQGNLTVSPCNGVGQNTDGSSDESIGQIAIDLIAREQAELEEERKISEIMAQENIPAGGLVVIDKDGMKIIHG